MRLVIFGCQQIAVDFLTFLSSRHDVDISLVVTYELPMDVTYGYKSVLNYCANSNIPVISPKFITSDIESLVRKIDPDIIFSIYYRKIFPKSLLNLSRRGCVNIHPSILPYYRGPVPTAWAIENGETQFGITIHQMDEKIDTGDILCQELYPIKDEETGFELYTRAMKLGASLLCENFDQIISGNLTPKPQIGPGSYYGKKNGKCTLDWRDSAVNIRNLIRVHAKPFNPVETILFNRYIFINKASIYDMPDRPLQGAGVIVKVLENNKFVVSCADGYLKIDEYDIAPPLASSDFTVYIKEGNRFG